MDGRISLSFDVTLPAVDRTVKRLSRLEGEFYAVAPTKMLAFTFAPLDQLAAVPADDALRESTLEGVECRVGKVVAEDDHWSVEIVLDYPEGNVKLDSYESVRVVDDRDGSWKARTATASPAILTCSKIDAAPTRS